jgi:glycosyltransferase involved in cell wall biosynthesis
VHFHPESSLAGLLESKRFDAIHAITSTLTIGLTDAIRRTGFRGAVVAVCHNDYVIGWNRALADAVVVSTGWWARKVRPYTDCPVQVIGNPVELDVFSPPPASAPAGPPRLGWIGRSADPFKNVGRLRDILAALPPDSYEVHVADGNARTAKEVFGELAPRIRFYGQVPYAEMPAFYRGIAASGGALLSTSDEEALPMSVLQAMSCGCPVVLPDAWGAEEIVEPGLSGLIYRREQSPQSALACLRELRDPGRWRDVSVAARRRIEDAYSEDRVVDQYVELLRAGGSASRDAGVGQRLAWNARLAGCYLRPTPTGIARYRPRCAQEAMDRAVDYHRAGQQRAAKADLLAALRLFPPFFLRSWRAKFLLRSLVAPPRA